MREDSFSVGIFAADFAVADTISGGIRDYTAPVRRVSLMTRGSGRITFLDQVGLIFRTRYRDSGRDG
jgi:hypothetical protein